MCSDSVNEILYHATDHSFRSDCFLLYWTGQKRVYVNPCNETQERLFSCWPQDLYPRPVVAQTLGSGSQEVNGIVPIYISQNIDPLSGMWWWYMSFSTHIIHCRWGSPVHLTSWCQSGTMQPVCFCKFGPKPSGKINSDCNYFRAHTF